jgi:CO/xanthine dehydrogenase Mo-binding subunit
MTPDVGGGFGAKIGAYPEELLLGVIAKRIGRPVRWRETRSESMVALGHGRAQLQYVTIGGTREGRVTHYQLHALQDSGAWVDMGTILAPFMTRPMASGVYDIPNIECRTTSVVTNTTPTVAYRGAGRPEATAAIERAMDLFAAEIGKDAAEVRRINLIAKFLEPHTTVVGQTYDVGDYETALDKALVAADYATALATLNTLETPLVINLPDVAYYFATGGDVDDATAMAKFEVWHQEQEAKFRARQEAAARERRERRRGTPMRRPNNAAPVEGQQGSAE